MYYKNVRMINHCMLLMVLFVFLIFDFATRESLFQLSLPHLKLIEERRDEKMTKLFAIVSDLSDKNAYVVIMTSVYHLFDVKNARKLAREHVNCAVNVNDGPVQSRIELAACSFLVLMK